ncbi:Rad4-domain-containing protein [Mollisia scopiformis]|uniref:Rad4-domain-containing protein n=1 Tax=Mollisia scopiformis TaxID=149040 RepID=A0A194X8Q4_MOLSC|nr:Rad4-domain-containing protein [Mollisia scopiformis]KUJ16494.1 Rad4-domain-containing protein [Mollisia scopiformis]
MPPFLPRKRLRSPTPEPGPSRPAPAKSKGKGKAVTTTPRKPTLFDDLDAGTGTRRSAEHGKAMLEKLAATSDDESSLSSLSDEEFEDVPNAKRQKISAAEEDDDEDEDIEFEDVDTNVAPGASANISTGDLELTLTKDTRISITNPFGTKKGPSKIERGIRVDTHKMHVQFLMWHNAVRNGWCCDKEVQEILVKQLPKTLLEAVEKWKRDSGLEVKEDREDGIPKGKGKGKGKTKDTKTTKGEQANSRRQSDWAASARPTAEGQVNMSAGDPLFNLLEKLRRYWKSQFRITAPGLRKLGYMSLQRLDKASKTFKENYDPERHGERIRNIKEFRACAQIMEGSRDVGAQLFTALLRVLGLETRLVASLQPAGFGWSASEEASKSNPRRLKKSNAADDSSDEETSAEEEEVQPLPQPISKPAKKAKAPTKSKAKTIPKPLDLDEEASFVEEEEAPVPKSVRKGKTAGKSASKPSRRTSRGNGLKNAPIDLSDSEAAVDEEDDDSVIDITPAKQVRATSLSYDKDLPFPHYWSEVLSPVTNTYTPVDAVVLHLVGTGRETIEKFETRGVAADKGKQVTAYIIGHSSDGTAKDVTTRYLKKHVWPGRTKGYRYPAEKIAIRNRHGKIKRYEEYDWFKTVMSSYVRGTRKCPRTDIDDYEEATDLKRVKPEKKEVEEGKETLQYYKSSPEFVLERHFKREEALVPTAKHVKMFTIKGKGEVTTDEKVYLRKDVVNCKSIETWHKEGRAPKDGEEPLKRVPYRAATTNRRRELAEAENASGEKVLQGLYSWDQTDWIIPPPIENGIIPKNNFGNIDLYVDSMLPEGAVHLPMRGTVKICKRLGIDYAEAVTGFEFGHRMAVPVITGVVVAEEHYETMMDEWHKDEAERVRKEDEKRRKAALGLWRKMLMGLRIIERFKEERGDGDDDTDVLNPFANKKKRTEDAEAEAQKKIMDQRDEEMAGGFLPEGFETEEPEERHPSFFPVVQEHDDEEEEGGGFVVEGHDEPSTTGNAQAYATPQSLEPITKNGVADASEEDVEMQDPESEVEAPAPKKRGRPPGSSAAKPKAKTPAKRVPKPKTPTSKKASKSKSRIQDSEQDDDDESTLSDLDSEIEEPPKKTPAKRASGRQARTTVDSLRKTLKRGAARKSETALRSHYFEHSDEEMDDE